MSDSETMAAALRLLARRARSERELSEYLRRKGFAEDEITVTLSRCRQSGYLDDNRFAKDRARELMRGGRAVGRRILVDLQRRGIDESIASAALEHATEEFGEATLLEGLCNRRYPDFAWSRADDRQRQRVVGYFLRRGFPSSLVLSFLRER